MTSTFSRFVSTNCHTWVTQSAPSRCFLNCLNNLGMAGEGREAIEDAKQAGDDILERGRLLKEYVETTHNGAIKKAVRRQNLAFEKIFTALNEVQGGGDDEN